MSRAWPADGDPSSSLGVSTTSGTPAIDGWASSSANGSEPDRALADGRVPVALGAALVERVVGVHEPEPAGADRRLEGVERRRHPARDGEVVSGGPRVAGVEADADLRVVLQRRQVRAEVLDRSRPATSRRRRSARSAGAARGRGARRAPAAAARAAAGAPPRSGPRRRRSRRAPRPRHPSRVPRARLCAMEAIDCSTVAAVGEPTLTRNGVWTNDGTPRSRQPAVNSSSCSGSPAVSFQPRGLPTKTCTAPAPRRRCRRGRPWPGRP